LIIVFDRAHPEGITTDLVIIFDTVDNKTGQMSNVLKNLLSIESTTRCVDIVDSCVSIYGSILLGNASLSIGKQYMF
jgi:hypothetical protein